MDINRHGIFGFIYGMVRVKVIFKNEFLFMEIFSEILHIIRLTPDSNDYGAIMGLTWVHVGPMNLAFGDYFIIVACTIDLFYWQKFAKPGLSLGHG